MSVRNSLLLATIGLCAIQPVVAADGALASDSAGGFSYGTPGKDPFWFKLNGMMQMDHTQISGNAVSKSTQFKSNTNLRRASVGLSGGIDNDWSYVFSLDMDSDRKLKLNDAFATYKGFHERLAISIGQVNPSFSLENTASSKWLPFIERSMPAEAFGPAQGLGISASFYDKHYAVAGSIVAPGKNDHANTNQNGSANNTKADQLVYSARATLAPINDDGKVAQLGISGHFEENKDSWIEFKTMPEIRTRSGIAVINTTDQTTAGTKNRSIQAKNHSTLAFELSGQHGPLYAEVEYQTTHVKRSAGQGENLTFHGYHAEAAYVLTGEHRKYNIINGSPIF